MGRTVKKFEALKPPLGATPPTPRGGLVLNQHTPARTIPFHPDHFQRPPHGIEQDHVTRMLPPSWARVIFPGMSPGTGLSFDKAPPTFPQTFSLVNSGRGPLIPISKSEPQFRFDSISSRPANACMYFLAIRSPKSSFFRNPRDPPPAERVHSVHPFGLDKRVHRVHPFAVSLLLPYPPKLVVHPNFVL